MTSAKHKYDWLKTKSFWGAKSPNNKKIVARTAALIALKGQLKLDPKLSTIANKGKKDNKRGKQKKNKKYTNFCHVQKRDKVLQKESPKEGNKNWGR